MEKLLEKIFVILQKRKKTDKKSSYVSSMYNKGTKIFLKKLKEETKEVIISIKNFKKNKYKDKVLRYKIIKETADLIFHTLICVYFLEILNTEIVKELSKRLNISGLEEKKNRKKK